MKEFELRCQMYIYITFDWVLGDIRPLNVRTVCTTVRKVVCCMYLTTAHDVTNPEDPNHNSHCLENLKYHKSGEDFPREQFDIL